MCFSTFAPQMGEKFDELRKMVFLGRLGLVLGQPLARASPLSHGGWWVERRRGETLKTGETIKERCFKSSHTSPLPWWRDISKLSEIMNTNCCDPCHCQL